MTNYRVQQQTYIVDRLFDRAELRVGPNTAVNVTCVHHLASR